jgi:hypothetical protein
MTPRRAMPPIAWNLLPQPSDPEVISSIKEPEAGEEGEPTAETAGEITPGTEGEAVPGSAKN